MSVHDEQERARLAAEARARGLLPWQAEMANAVTTNDIAGFVNDLRRGPAAPSSMAVRPGRSEPEPERPRTNGWAAPAPLVPTRGRWRETEDEKRARIVQQQALEAAEIERRLDRDDE
jgi:hypothetical protein